MAGRDKGSGGKVKEIALGPYVILNNGGVIARVKGIKVRLDHCTPEEIEMIRSAYLIILQKAPHPGQVTLSKRRNGE